MPLTKHDALLDDLILDDLIDQEIAALTGGEVYPVPHITLDRYVVACRNQAEFPFTLDDWQLDLCRRLEKAFWCANAKKFDFLTKLISGVKSVVSPSGFPIDIGEFKEYENLGINAAIHGPPQFGKPCYNGSMVLLSNGTYKRLDEIKVGDRVITHTGQGRRVAAVHVQGDLECVEIVTNTGRRAIAALDHPFLTPDGWVEAGKLSVGQCVANVSEPGIAATAARDDAEFEMLGYFVGDGAVGPAGPSIHANITSDDRKQAARFIELSRKLGFEHRVFKKKNTSCLTYAFRGGVRPWLRETGIAGHTSGFKRVPEWVFRGTQSQVAKFLGAYFSCDGTLSLKGLDRHGKPRPDGALEFYSISEGLLRDVQSLLLRVGVQSRLSEKVASYKKRPHKSWRLTITSQDYIAQFARSVPVWGVKGEKLRSMRAYRQSFQPKVLPDKVAAVNRVGKMPCRCLSVEKDCTFTVNDLVVHNTIIISTDYPAWIFGYDPLHRFRLAMYGMEHAQLYSVAIRRRLQGPEHQTLFPDPKGHLPAITRIKEWSTNARLKVNDGQHSFIAMGLDSGFVGTGVDTLVQDDPYRSPEKARSPKIRDTTWRFQTETAQPRMLLHTNDFVMHHRYHNDDQGGRAIASGRFFLWRYAAIADGEYEDETSGRKFPCLPLGRKKGEPLSKRDIYPPWYYENKKKEDPDVWNAQFQGRPTTKEGTFFDTSKINVLTAAQFELLTMIHQARAWDNAATPKDGDFTAGARVANDAMDNYYLFNMRRDQVDTAGRLQLQELAAVDDGLMVPILFPRDPAQAGKDVAFFFRQEYEPRGYTVVVHDVTGAKTARADEFSKIVNSGKFYLVVNDATEDDPKGENGKYLSPAQVKALKAELRDFPMVGLYDDQVDCTADAVTYLKKLFLKGRVVKVNGDNNVLPWTRFVKRFGDRIPAHWEVAIAARFSANSSLPSGWAMLARAAENARLGEVVFFVASARRYVGDPGVILTDIKDAVQIYCGGGMKQVQSIFIGHGKGAVDPDAIIPLARDKFELDLMEFQGDEELGLTEAAWYMQPLKAPHPFYDPKEPLAQGREASRCYILSDDDQVETAKNEKGQLSLRQDMMNWSYNDEGKPQPFGGIVLDCGRMTLYNFWLTATGLTDIERQYAKLPAHLQPEALQAKLGTEEFVTDYLAQKLELGKIAEREREQRDEDSGRFTGPRRRERFRK